jgi:uncharacterized protein
MDYEEKLNSIVMGALKNDKSGHDYVHSIRVLEQAKKIAQHYQNVDSEVLTAACLLHDIAFRDGWVKDHHLTGAKLAKSILEEISFPKSKIQLVQIAIEDHVGNIEKPIRKDSELLIESKILRDSDNLDALGSIGLIRMISFCIANNIPYFKSMEDGWDESIYGGVKTLLTWPSKMLTPEARKIAETRLPVMKDFLKQLEKEYS